MTQPLNFSRPSFPEMYEKFLVAPLFQPWAEMLLDGAALAAGDGLLDIACGTGIVPRLAKQRLGDAGRVVGVDLSPQMLTVANTMAPGVDFREGSAAALPVAAGETFTVVTCQQGLQFFPDKAAAAGEMRRVLAPGGRLGVSTWRPIEEIPLFRDLHRVAEQHLGPVVDQRHAFGDATAIERLFAEAGFNDIQVKTMARTIRFADGAVFARLNAMALVGMSPASKSMSDEARAETVATIAGDSASVLPSYAQGDGIAFEISTNVATARG